MSAPLRLLVAGLAVVCATGGVATPPRARAAGAPPDTAAAVTAPDSAAAVTAPDTAAAVPVADTTLVRPELRWSHDGPLVGACAALAVVGVALDPAVKAVPPEGLDPSGIRWSYDRASLGHTDARAETQSDYVLGAALLFPMVTTYASQPPGERGSGTLRRSAMYAEALVLAQGLTSVLKNSTSRPRPYAYLPAERRWDEPAYDVTADAAFQSMPSGHSSLAFCAASFAMTDNLISRPRARWVERVGVPFVGGALAGMTAAMRVEGGVHFPSDVIAGGLIGTSCGVAVPLLHRYFDAGGRTAPRPSARAWGEAIAGLLAGVGAGILAADAVY